MKIIYPWILLLLVACSSDVEKQADQPTEKKETEQPAPESEEEILSKLLEQIKTDVGDVSRFIAHVRFVLSPDCAYLMMLEEDKEFYEEADFRKYYPKIFTEQVIEKIQSVQAKDVEITRDEAGKMIGFRVSLNFSEYIKEAEMNDEWALILDFLIEEETYTLFCMRGAG